MTISPFRTRAALLGLLVTIAACATSSVASGASDENTINFGGYERHYVVHKPAGIGDRAVPLVVALHGGVGTGKIMEEQTGLDAVADQHDFIVVYPDGVGRAWNAGSCCAKPMKEKIDDVGFVRAVIADVKHRYKIDATRIYGTGFSNGAMLLHRIACDAPDTFAAIAPVSGGPMVSNCNERRPIPALLIQGRADPRIPWGGGEFQGSYRPSIKDIVSRLGKRNECTSDEQETSDTNGVQCRTLRGCRSGDEVSWCGIIGAGHQWPGGKTYLKFLLGANNERFNASQKIWAFFSKYRKD
ncbi:MAG TPA: PHB depolymerase family esterase [Solimonas sp.]